jgi:1-acyl-sn-glycerol-3-phosphate acyltransferase
MLKHPFRVFGRLICFLIVAVSAVTVYYFGYHLRGRRSYRDRSEWAHQWAMPFVRCLKLRITSSGEFPERGILTANHMGYLDIVVLSALQPLVFVSKSEVRRWPIIGALAACGGTLFVNRQKKSDVATLGPAFAPVINTGTTLVLFPEGTSTGGDRVLPFMPSLLEPAVQNNWPVTPAWISYSLDEGEGSVADNVAYWRDMTFLPHFLNLLTKPVIYAKVVYGQPVPPGLNRKEMARLLHDQVATMAGFSTVSAPTEGVKSDAASID